MALRPIPFLIFEEYPTALTVPREHEEVLFDNVEACPGSPLAGKGSTNGDLNTTRRRDVTLASGPHKHRVHDWDIPPTTLGSHYMPWLGVTEALQQFSYRAILDVDGATIYRSFTRFWARPRSDTKQDSYNADRTVYVLRREWSSASIGPAPKWTTRVGEKRWKIVTLQAAIETLCFYALQAENQSLVHKIEAWCERMLDLGKVQLRRVQDVEQII
ncbi:hypothetical protein C8F01DRAFT_1089779 [Mycena amicta]|nr:hypothetical protein C8F01DRAFT_1089779 [Mycena amicta]